MGKNFNAEFDGPEDRYVGRNAVNWRKIRERTAEKQGWQCAICKAPLRNGKHVHLDHDHTTGKLRGVLCRGCNVGIGCFREDPVALAAAIQYLLRHST